MKRTLQLYDVGLIRFARAYVDGTIAERKAMRDAVQAMMDQAADTMEAAGFRLDPNGGFSGGTDGPIELDLDTDKVGLLAHIVETARWPAQLRGIEDRLFALRDDMQLWLRDANAEDAYNNLPESTRKALAERAKQEAD